LAYLNNKETADAEWRVCFLWLCETFWMVYLSQGWYGKGRALIAWYLKGLPLPDTIDREIYHLKSETIAWNHHSLRPPLNNKAKLTNKEKKE